VYLGAALLVIVAAIFSSNGKKTPTQQAAKGQPPQPMLQDNTDNNLRDLKNQVQAERQKDQQAALAAAAQYPALAAAAGLSPATPAQQAAAATYGPNGIAAPCTQGQPCLQAPAGYGQPNSQPQPTPEQQQMQQLAAKERERADESRFASNLVYARLSDQPQQQQQGQGQPQPSPQAMPVIPRQTGTSLVAPRAPGDQIHQRMTSTAQSGSRFMRQSESNRSTHQRQVQRQGHHQRTKQGEEAALSPSKFADRS